ncbi:MAG: hypothetical protein R2729_17585 [Bryobacteraceae bacterium]
MESKRRTKRSRLRELLAGVELVDPALRERLAAQLAPVSGPYLRKLLRESGVALDPLVEGVRQDTFEDLERTLRALARCYGEAADRAEAAAIRRVVIEAKDHARLAARRHPGAEGDEKILWMLTWLENPPVFETWLSLRKARIDGTQGERSRWE